MEYLFFDIECANCFDNIGKICEFGYVLVDKNFNIKEQENILVNPNSVFDRYVLDKMLAYKEYEYKCHPKYPEVYSKIKSLFNDNVMVFGHTVDADAKYINDENKRYNLPFFDFQFYDVMYIYKEFSGNEQKQGLSKIAKELNCTPPIHEHRALDDSITTMNVLKAIVDKTNLIPEELVDKYISSKGQVVKGKITTVAREQAKLLKIEKEKNSDKMTSDRFKTFLNLVDNCKPEGKIIKNCLTGKKVCITSNYQNTHYREMLNLVQLLKNCGATFVLKVTRCDVFVKKEVLNKDGLTKKCTRLESVYDQVKKGKDIKIITFEELLNILKIKEEELVK